MNQRHHHHHAFYPRMVGRNNIRYFFDSISLAFLIFVTSECVEHCSQYVSKYITNISLVGARRRLCKGNRGETRGYTSFAATVGGRVGRRERTTSSLYATSDEIAYATAGNKLHSILLHMDKTFEWPEIFVTYFLPRNVFSLRCLNRLLKKFNFYVNKF